MISLISPADCSQFSILCKAQTEFIRRSRNMSREDALAIADNPYPWFDQSICDTPDLNQPASIIIKWKNTVPLSQAVIHLATDPDFTVTERIATIGSICYSAEDDIYFSVINNLLSGTTYYWKVSAGEDVSETRSFSTLYGEMRTIRAEGVGNIRDFGGRVNIAGKRIRQGLVYRGAMMNNLLKPECASCNGMGVLKDDLEIKTDIDLRWEAVGKYEFCPLGDHVKYHLFTTDSYESIFDDGQDELYRKIFELIADEGNYPIYLHCVSGADRTGSVGFLLDGLLGMSDEDIILNYNFTSLSTMRCWYTNVAKLPEILDEKFPGLSLADQLTMTLRSFGVTEETMNRIRNNLLE